MKVKKNLEMEEQVQLAEAELYNLTCFSKLLHELLH